MAVGEDNPRLGDQGTRRAKRWLNATTRVGQAWTNEDAVPAGKLTFSWPYDNKNTFSFDLGGVFKGDPFQSHHFVAESKKYTDARDQGTHYDNWVAKCYVARMSNPAITDHFLWITWAPFRASDWSDQLTAAAVRRGLLYGKNPQRVFNTADIATAESLIDGAVVEDVAKRLWIIVLSDKQESLVVSAKHRGWIAQRETEEEA